MERTSYWLAVVAYCLVVIGIGYWLKRRHRAAEGGGDSHLEFWMAGRQIPGWRLGISLTAGWLMLGWIGFGMSQIYMYGVTGLWILPIPWFILCFLIIAAVPLVRRIGAISLPQAIEKRFGVSARAVLAVFSFFVFISWTQAELFMAGTLLSPFLGVAPWVCMIVLVVPIMLYTYMGGFRAIVATDLVQFAIMAAFMIVLAAVAVSAAGEASGGAIMETLSKATPPWSGPGEVWNAGFLGWLFPIVLLVGYLPGWLIEQDLTLRIQAARSTRQAVRGAVLALVLITVFILVLPSIAAFCALVAFPPAAGGPPAELIGADATGIISALIAKLPLAGSIFMVVGLLACQMSTVDTFTNVSAMPLAYDLIEPLVFKRRLTNSQKAALARCVSLLVILIALGLAVISERLGDVYYISSGVLSASIAVPAIFIFWKRTTLPAVIASSILGAAGTVGMYLVEYKYANAAELLPSWLKQSLGYNYVAFGVVVAVVSIVGVSLLTPKPAEKLLASVRPKPVDDMDEFAAGVS